MGKREAGAVSTPARGRDIHDRAAEEGCTQQYIWHCEVEWE
jgi:hypothetical protein